MRFVKKLTQGDSRSFVYLDVGDLKIPGTEGMPQEQLQKLLSFHIETYNKLKAKRPEKDWTDVFGAVHEFLDSLSKEDQAAYASLIVFLHYKILEAIGGRFIEQNQLLNLETDLSHLICEFAQKTNLHHKLLKFAHERLTFKQFGDVGKRPQDSDQMTFYADDVYILTAIGVLCKLFVPIFGVFIECCKKKLDNLYKEFHCAAIFKDVLASDPEVKRINTKLQLYISRIVKPLYNKKSSTMSYNGLTFNLVVQQIYAAMLTRRFVTVNLYEPDGNLLIYVTSCARAAATSQFKSSAGGTAVQQILDPHETSSDGDGNISELENETRSSNCPADFVILVKAAVKQTEERFLDEFNILENIPEDNIKLATEYYQAVHVTLTPINAWLIALVFGNRLGGAQSVEMLDGVSVDTLIPLMQAYFIQQDYVDLVHASSINISSTLKAEPTGADKLLATTWNSGYEYSNCANKFTVTLNDLKWDTQLEYIVRQVTEHPAVYNTAPAYWELLGSDVRNGQFYDTPETLAKSICKLITQLNP